MPRTMIVLRNIMNGNQWRLPVRRTGFERLFLLHRSGFGGSSAVVHDALVSSASHLANIVGPTYTRIGVGAYTDATGRLWVCEVFAG